MAQLWQVSKNLMGWWMNQQQETPCNCDGPDEEDGHEQQTSSGVGTVIVIYTALAGLFIGANLLPSQLGRGTPALQNQEVRKVKQQRGRGKRQVQDVAARRSSKRLRLDNWQDAQEPNSEEEAQWRQMNLPENFFDLPTENSDDHFMEVRDD